MLELEMQSEKKQYEEWLAKEKRWSVPFELVKPVLLAWCAGCNTFYPLEDGFTDETCWNDCETEMGRARRLRKRWTYKCRGCDGHYLTKDDFRYHEHTYF